VIRSNATLAAGHKDTVQLRVRATEFDATWSETASALVGTGLPIPVPASVGPSAPPPSGTVCGGTDKADYAVSDQTFSIPGSASARPSASASASHSRSASASSMPAPSASLTGRALATTGGGSNSGVIAGVAGSLILAGGAAVFAVRRRRAAHN
jgi:LPXTG-motif cell wall-anchored protein